MTAPLDIAELNARALAHRADVLAQIIQRDRGHADRVTSQLRALNWSAPRLADLHVSLDEAGRWSASTDNASTSGRGAVSLVAALACVSPDRAAAFLRRLLPAEAAT